jgi:hypothetical protein
MPKDAGTKTTLLSPSSPSAPCSYELQGQLLIARLFGLIPVFSIHLSNVHYLRLATRDEVTPLYLMSNWLQFLPHRRSVCPVYVLQAKTGRRLFLKLEGGAHFALRKAIGRTNEQKHHSSRPNRLAA